MRLSAVILTIISLVCIIGPGSLVRARYSKTPTITPFSTYEVRTDFKIGHMVDMGEVFYMHYATSYWDILTSDDPRMEGENIIKICGFFTKTDPPTPIELWGTFKVKNNGVTTWRGQWHTGFDSEGNPAVYGWARGAGPNRGLHLNAVYYSGFLENGQMYENGQGHIIDIWGRS